MRVCAREQVRVRACFCARDLHVSEWSCFILFHHQCVSGMLADREMAKPYVFGSALSLPPCRCEKHFFYGCSCFGVDILCHGPCAPDRFLISRSVVLNQAGLWLVAHLFFPSHGAEAASPSRATPRRSRVDDSDGSQSECRRARVACAGTSKDEATQRTTRGFSDGA